LEVQGVDVSLHWI